VAGIGFELQRVLRRGGIGSFVKVALSGIMIVAGPWLLSIIGIFLIGRFAGFALQEGRSLFTGVIVYSYAFSLFIFGGSHYIFTRLLSDLIYVKKNRQAASLLLFFSLIVVVLAAGIASAAISRVTLPGVSRPLLFKSFAVAFFAIINLAWLLMIFISLLKKYVAIFLVFLGGMILSVVGVLYLGRTMALGGAMLGFFAGQSFTVLLLLFLSFKEYRPAEVKETLKALGAYFPKYGFLFLSGLFYYWGIWIDKMVFWATVGQPVTGTFFRLFDTYDIPVYLANLTMIPGLVYFIVVLETDFYTYLKSFLQSLGEGILSEIQARKNLMAEKLKTGLREQSLFQGVITAAFLVLAPSLSRIFSGLNVGLLRITMLAVFFQLLFLTEMTFLFYFEQYRPAFIAALFYFIVNLGGSLLIVSTGKQLFGLSYLAAGMVSTLICALYLFRIVHKAHRLVLARYTT
jgi:uncharacterized membrane protein